MLTIQIDNAQLEQRLLEEAHTVGKTTQEVVNELLNRALADQSGELTYPQLDPKEHGYIINYELDDDTFGQLDNPPFSRVTDVAAFADELRKQTWRR